MTELSGRTAVITGATGGLGMYISRALAHEGMHLVLSAPTQADLDRAVAKLLEAGTHAVGVSGDLVQRGTIDCIVATAEQVFGCIHVLVNNAGIESFLPYHRLEMDRIERIVQVNLTAAMILTRAVLPLMLKVHQGHIVNISSLSGKAPPPFVGPYAATKAGLIAFTESIRAEYRGSGISASAICPGFVKTGIYQRVVEQTGISAPRMLVTSKPDAVARAVVRAIKRDLPEVIVNPGPIRLLTALAELSPSLGEILIKATGAALWFQKVAHARGAQSNEE